MLIVVGIWELCFGWCVDFFGWLVYVFGLGCYFELVE